MKLRSCEHLNLVVSDARRSLDFYRRLGLGVVGTLDGGKSMYLSSGDENSPVRIELKQDPERQSGIDHVAFEVDGVEAACRELELLGGVELLYGPWERPRSGRVIAGLRDPDGVHIQLCKLVSAPAYLKWG